MIEARLCREAMSLASPFTPMVASEFINQGAEMAGFSRNQVKMSYWVTPLKPASGCGQILTVL